MRGLDPCVGLDTVADVRVKGAIGVVELTGALGRGTSGGRVPLAGRLAPALRDAALHDAALRVYGAGRRADLRGRLFCRGERGGLPLSLFVCYSPAQTSRVVGRPRGRTPPRAVTSARRRRARGPACGSRSRGTPRGAPAARGRACRPSGGGRGPRRRRRGATARGPRPGRGSPVHPTSSARGGASASPPPRPLMVTGRRSRPRTLMALSAKP